MTGLWRQLRSRSSTRAANWLGALVAVLVLTGFALLLLSGQYIREGPVVVRLSANHGIHRGDVFIVAGWVAGVAGAVLAAIRRPS